MLITFEGIEGAGKTTQIKLLCDELSRRNLPFISIREPGGTPFSEQIRSILLSDNFSAGDIAEFLLFEASRAELVKDVIIPALSDNKIVICDRFTDSTIAYQGYGRGLPLDIINSINDFVTSGVKVTRTYLLDNSLEVMQRRSEIKEKDRIENEGSEFHRRVRAGFLALAKEHPERILLIDSSREISEVHNIIISDFLKLL